MLKKTILMHPRLTMFDEGAVAGEMAQTEGGQPSQESKETGDNEVKILYGKQPEKENPAAEEPKAQSPEERRKAYDEYIRGEGKEFYTQDTQNMINRRFRAMKGLEEENATMRNAMAPLMKKYGVDNAADLEKAIQNDDSIWQQEADDAGLSVEQVKERNSILEENKRLKDMQAEQERRTYADRQYKTWISEAREIQKVYPDFNINTELLNADFARLLTNGVPMRQAYEVLHMADIKNRTEKEVGKAVSENIRNRGKRPAENGASGSAGVVVKSDPSQFTDEDMDEIVKRVKAGEKIIF